MTLKIADVVKRVSIAKLSQMLKGVNLEPSKWTAVNRVEETKKESNTCDI